MSAAEAAAAATRDDGVVRGEDSVDTCKDGKTGEAGHSEDGEDGEGTGDAEAVDEDVDASVADGRGGRETARVVLAFRRDLIERRTGDDARGMMVALSLIHI